MLAQRVFFYIEDLLLVRRGRLWRRAFSRLFEVSSHKLPLSAAASFTHTSGLASFAGSCSHGTYWVSRGRAVRIARASMSCRFDPFSLDRLSSVDRLSGHHVVATATVAQDREVWPDLQIRPDGILTKIAPSGGSGGVERNRHVHVRDSPSDPAAWFPGGHGNFGVSPADRARRSAR